MNCYIPKCSSCKKIVAMTSAVPGSRLEKRRGNPAVRSVWFCPDCATKRLAQGKRLN